MPAGTALGTALHVTWGGEKGSTQLLLRESSAPTLSLACSPRGGMPPQACVKRRAELSVSMNPACQARAQASRIMLLSPALPSPFTTFVWTRLLLRPGGLRRALLIPSTLRPLPPTAGRRKGQGGGGRVL